MFNPHKDGFSTFTHWKTQTQLGKWWSKFLGPFDASITAEEASKRLEHEKLSESYHSEWNRGWEDARKV